MEKYLEKIMNFINENTMLLIIICIFLIVILVIYLIDNTIKSKKLEKAELENKGNEEPKVLNNSIPEEEVPAVEEVAPVVPEVVPVVEEKVETTVVEPTVEPVTNVEPTEVETAPIVDTSIEELLNKDYSSNNTVVDNIPEEVVSTPIEEKPKNKYSNDKKLSDIFGKKEEKVESKIENTKDFSDELDRILKKLNEEEARIDNSSIEETSDYTNMF